MFLHNIKIAFRSFQKDKSTFLINLIGLSAGLACAIMIFMWVIDEVGMNKFHKNDDRLFQVMSNVEIPDGMMTWSTTPVPLTPAFKKEMPEIKEITSSTRSSGKYGLSYDGIHLNGEGLFVYDNYFKVFSFEMLEGNMNQLFPNKSSVAISESTANKLFKTTENVIGKTVDYNSPVGKKSATISAIFKDTPNNSTQQFDFLFPFELYQDSRGESLHWGNLTVGTFAVLQDNVNVEEFNNKIKGYLRPKREGLFVDPFLQRYSERYLYGSYENGEVAGGRITYVRLFSIIAIFILLIACINFMNLSTANATKKLKEIGVKKTIGADRSTLIFQYLGESLMLSFLSLFIALITIYFILPEFNHITGKALTLNFETSLLSTILGITAITGIVSGSYPALYLSGFNTVEVLKGKVNNSLGGLWARRGLVIFQFSISIILIVSVLVVYKQIEFIQAKKLGFNKSNVVHFPVSEKDQKNLEVLTAEIQKIPEVSKVSSMQGNFIGQTAFTAGPFEWKGKAPDQQGSFHFLSVDYNALELLEFEMAEGRSFSKDFANEDRKIIFNEAGIKALGFEQPIGETFTLWREDYEIIGVLEDFHFSSLYNNIEPFFITLGPSERMSKVLVKIQNGKDQLALTQLEALYKKYNPNAAFEYEFLDSDYQQMYAAETRISTLSKYFASIAIIISCLGLFGLAAFTAQRRIKEISIRKVLGANPFSIVRLLTADFTKMVLVAISIGIPLSYFIAKTWLEDFAFRINLSVWFFIIAGLLTLTIAWITVILQTMKAANVNPVNNLKE